MPFTDFLAYATTGICLLTCFRFTAYICTPFKSNGRGITANESAGVAGKVSE
jgi:hypothetical protein